MALAIDRISDVPTPLRDLWRPDSCPADLLPWLAWTLSVDVWDPSWTEATKRGVIAASIDVHRHKGTRSAVVSALRSAGLGDAQLIERDAATLHDGAVLHDGNETYAAAGHWAEYRVVLARPLSITQAAVAREIIEAVAPLRSHLTGIDFQEAAILHDGTATYDGTYTMGVA